MREKKQNLKMIRLAVCTAALTITSSIPVYATNAYAEAGAKWFLDGVFWLVLAFGIVSAGMSAVKRNATAAVGILIATALICVLCKDPEILVNIGNVLKGILGI